MDRPTQSAENASDLDDLVGRLRAQPPSCGRVRLVAIDGHAGSGKSGFAQRLAHALGDAPILHIDDLATHDEFFGWTDRLRDQVLTALARDRTADYGIYDWTARAFTTVGHLAPAPVVLLEGVGTGRRDLRPWLSHLLWMELDADESWRRGRRRDGPGLSEFWDAWIMAECDHFASDPSRPHADLLITQRDGGYGFAPTARS
ncbi:uridine kinase family protein [Nocardia aurea]|uniref:Aminodeoxychorismate synthase n=1 Tax=Nocardia aurea TaxID=2144174 RepID=A0ABV3FM15_9NOCA